MTVVVHRDHFRPDAPDAEWVPTVGARGWIILTRDVKMRLVDLERQALMAVDAREFVVRGGSLPAAEVVARLERAWGKIEQLAHRGGGGFIAHVTASGVEVKDDFDRLKQRERGSG